MTAVAAPAVTTPTEGRPPLAERTLHRATRVLLGLFAVLTLIATVDLFVFAEHTDTAFAWTIKPPLTAAFLGAGYGAGFVLVVLSRRARHWAHVRVALLTVLVFTTLSLVATALDADRFHFTAPGLLARAAAWLWLAVYLVVPIALATVMIRQTRSPGPHPVRRHRLPGWLAVVLAVQGASMLSVGTALFAAPSSAALLWPWTLSSLTSRMVAAWLVAFGVATLLALVERDLKRLEIAAIGYAVFGLLQLLALALFGEAVRWGSVAATGYLTLLLTIPPTSAAAWWVTSRNGRPS